MKSRVELEVDVPREKLAALYADPWQSTNWMDDLERIEPVSGELGMPGSKYRLVPKKGGMEFVATVMVRQLPNALQLSLDAVDVAVAVKGTFTALSPARTRFISEEEFRFKGLVAGIVGLFARAAVQRAHRRHIEAFKRFAEAQP